MATPTQLKLIDFEHEISTGNVELFPSVWQATENLAAQEEKTRRLALDELLQLGAPRLSPLVAYNIATRLRDPVLSFRARIVESLANLLRLDAEGRPAPDQVRAYLVSYLSQMEQGDIQALLEIGVAESETKSHISKLLNLCPKAGRHLAQLVTDRKSSVPIRQLAANFIGLIGFIEALPTLERLRNRLETRLVGQKSMSFAPPSNTDETLLLPDIKAAITLLRVT